MKRSHSSPLSFLFPWLAPIIISFAIVDGGIEVQLSQNNKVLKNWQPSRLRRVLPEPLVKWMEDQRIQVGPQPYPLIKQFCHSLARHASKKLIIDLSVVAELKEGSRPQDFALVWELNRSLERIDGHYNGADRYLGMGWFQRGQTIWTLKSQPSAELDTHLKHPVYPLQHAAVLVASNISYLQPYLPARADFQVITDFALQVVVHNVSSSAITLALKCNYPQFLSTIKVPQQKVDVLLADRAVIQFPQQALTPVMIHLLQSGSAITLEGESIPLFIREQLPIMRQQHQIRDELVIKISQAHPIVPVTTLKPAFSLDHRFEYGIGKYSIDTTYTYQQHLVDMNALLTAHQRFQRFVRQHGVWFEWTDNAHSFVQTVLQQRASPMLRPEEVMGFDTQRTALLSDPPFSHPIQPTGTAPMGRAQSAFKQLRQHGVPGGLIGEPPGLVSMFVKACEDLMRDNRQASILWVAPSNKKGSVTRAVNMSTISSYVMVASPVTLRDQPALMSHLWTLVIFQELDKLLDSNTFFLRFDYFPWKWCLVSITSKHALSASILRALRLPQTYVDQFGARYLFDPLKNGAGSVPGKDASAFKSGQKTSTQSDNLTASLRSSTAPKIASPAAMQTQREQLLQRREQLLQQIEMRKQQQEQRPSAASASSTMGGTIPPDARRKPDLPSKQRPVDLNQHVIARLQQESEQLRERLMVEDEHESLSLSVVAQQVSDAIEGSTTSFSSQATGELEADADQVQARVTLEKGDDQAGDSLYNISPSGTEPVIFGTGAISVPEFEVDEDWKDIVPQWRPEHWEVILLLYQGKQAELASVERQARCPLSRLIDDINTPVDDVLGDLLIDPDTRTIASHLQSTAEALLHWYFVSKEK